MKEQIRIEIMPSDRLNQRLSRNGSRGSRSEVVLRPFPLDSGGKRRWNATSIPHFGHCTPTTASKLLGDVRFREQEEISSKPDSQNPANSPPAAARSWTGRIAFRITMAASGGADRITGRPRQRPKSRQLHHTAGRAAAATIFCGTLDRQPSPRPCIIHLTFDNSFWPIGYSVCT